jgi:hypothetical protein
MRPNNGMQRTRNWHVSHAGLVAGGGSCAPLMPSVQDHNLHISYYQPQKRCCLENGASEKARIKQKAQDLVSCALFSALRRN